jgi:uncharacterized protein (TIGR02145 family)
MKLTGTLLLIAWVSFIITACKDQNFIPKEPTIADTPMSLIDDSTFVIHGLISSDGGSRIIGQGICWSQYKDPNLKDSVIECDPSLSKFDYSFYHVEPGKTIYLRSFATNSLATVYGRLQTFKAANKIIINTLDVSRITCKEISCKINFHIIGNPIILEKGLCWSKHPNPTILDSKKTTESELTDLECNITGLDEGTTYFIKDYVITSTGTQYGNEYTLFTPTYNPMNPNIVYGSIIDIQFNIYKTITIGKQTWMAENLRATKYQSGDIIPYGRSNNDWNSVFGVQCTYGNTTKIDSISKFGRLYNWYSTNGIHKISPKGWHIPSIAEQKTLVEFLSRNGYNYDGAPSDENRTSKSLASNADWQFSPTFGTAGNLQSKNNKTGFNAFPSGGRASTYDGSFVNISMNFYLWLVDSDTLAGSYSTIINTTNSFVIRQVSTNMGLSIRCIKDN